MWAMKTSKPSFRAGRTDAAQRARLLAEFERSGLSAADFARQQGLNYTTFCGWRQRRDKTGTSPAFVQMEVTPVPVPVELVIEVGAGARMRLHSENQVALAARLLQHLNAAGPC
jgi:transposase-like protein